MIYDPVARQMVDEAACRALPMGDGWTLLRTPDGHWIAHRPWTGSTRLPMGDAENARVHEAEFGDRLLVRCALLSVRGSTLEETQAAALLQAHRREAVTRARDHGFSCAVVLEALRSVDEPLADDELDDGVRVVRLAELVE